MCRIYHMRKHLEMVITDQSRCFLMSVLQEIPRFLYNFNERKGGGIDGRKNCW